MEILYPSNSLQFVDFEFKQIINTNVDVTKEKKNYFLDKSENTQYLSVKV